MWDCHWWCCLIPTTLQKQPHHHNQTLLLTTHDQNDAVCTNCISFSAIAAMLTSWLNRRRIRYLFLIICSPFLIPLLCATCPFICAAEICFLICRRRRKAYGGDGGGRSEDDGGEVGLLQRYLEDQLSLVVGECGDDIVNLGGNDGVDLGFVHSARPLLQ